MKSPSYNTIWATQFQTHNSVESMELFGEIYTNNSFKIGIYLILNNIQMVSVPIRYIPKISPKR